MRNLSRFFVEINKLKKVRRRGWIAHDINPAESTASHSFRLAMMVWVLSGFKKLKNQKLIKVALIHDICEVYCFDATPYDPLLPKNLTPEKTKELLRYWPKFSPSEKALRKEAKYQDEYKGLKKITSYLPSVLQKEIIELWQEIERRKTISGVFVKQADKMENFFQGIEYWHAGAEIQIRLWLRWIKEIISDSVLIKFKKSLLNFFLKNQALDKKPMDQAVLFLIKIGELKLTPWQEWEGEKRKDMETIAEYNFSLALMAWILGQGVGLNVDKMIKMALIHNLTEIHFTKGGVNKRKESYFMGSIKEKRVKEKINKKNQKKTFRDIIEFLPSSFREEISLIVQEFNSGISKESRFMHQLIKVSGAFQAKQNKKNPSYFLNSWQAKLDREIDFPVLLELLSETRK